MPTGTATALDAFVASMRQLCVEIHDDEARWLRAASLLRNLLADAEIKAKSKEWPICDRQNLLFYEDPDYGFVVSGLTKVPGHSTSVHDHAHIWTLYGVLDGHETIVRYERLDDGSNPDHAELRKTSEFEAKPGDIDLVRPWQIHAEKNGDERSAAILIRSQKQGGFNQNTFNIETGDVRQAPGPTPVPYTL